MVARLQGNVFALLGVGRASEQSVLRDRNRLVTRPDCSQTFLDSTTAGPFIVGRNHGVACSVGHTVDRTLHLLTFRQDLQGVCDGTLPAHGFVGCHPEGCLCPSGVDRGVKYCEILVNVCPQCGPLRINLTAGHQLFRQSYPC